MVYFFKVSTFTDTFKFRYRTHNTERVRLWVQSESLPFNATNVANVYESAPITTRDDKKILVVATNKRKNHPRRIFRARRPARAALLRSLGRWWFCNGVVVVKPLNDIITEIICIMVPGRTGDVRNEDEMWTIKIGEKKSRWNRVLSRPVVARVERKKYILYGV